MQFAQAGKTDEALWNAVRALQEKEMLSKAAADARRNEGDAVEAERLALRAVELADHWRRLMELLEQIAETPE